MRAAGSSASPSARDSNGKRVRVHDVVRGTRKDAQRYPDHAALSRKDHGLPTTLSRETLGEWVAEWLKNWTGTKGPRTQYDYRQTFRRIFERDALLGGVRLTALTPERIQQFISQLQSTKKRKQVKKRSDKKSEARVESDELLSPRTIRIYHGALRTVLNDAMRLGKVQRNVVSLVRPPKLNRCDRTFLSPEQTEHFLTASADAIRLPRSVRHATAREAFVPSEAFARCDGVTSTVEAFACNERWSGSRARTTRRSSPVPRRDAHGPSHWVIALCGFSIATARGKRNGS